MRALWTLCFLLFSISPVCGEEEFRELFNGRDLTGWTGDGGIWSVQEGLLTGQTKTAQDIDRNTFATWTGGVLKDFDLRVEFRVEGDGNSGVQYRSRRDQ